MRIRLGTRVRTKDGRDAGEVKRVVWDPASNEVRSVVVSTGGLLGHDVLISPDVVDRATDDDHLAIDLTKDELGALDRYEEKGYAPPPIGWTAPAMYGLPAAAFLFPIEPVTAPGPAEPRRARPAIVKGMRVKDPDGNDVGVVTELRVDDMTGELRAIVVEERAGLGSGERTEIPADHLDVAADEVRLIEGPNAAATRRAG